MSELDLNVPLAQPAPRGGGGLLWRAAVIVLLVACAFGAWMPRPPAPGKAEAPVFIGAAYDEDLVLRLKKAGAYKEAASLIESVVSRPDLEPVRRARLLKTQAGLYAAGDERGKALLCLYRAEKELGGAEEALGREISAEIISILRAGGDYGAVSDELADRNRKAQGRPQSPSDPVVARVDGAAITRSDLDVIVEERLSARLEELSSDAGSGEEKLKLAEDIRRQYAAPYERMRLLEEHAMREIMLREAEKWKLEEHPEYRKTMKAFREELLRSLLVRTKVLPSEISASDLDNYMEARRTELGLSTEPGRLKPEELEKARPAAEKKYREEKLAERTRAFQEELMKRHQVEIVREAFTEGGR